MTDLLMALVLVSALFGVVSAGSILIYCWGKHSTLRYWKAIRQDERAKENKRQAHKVT